MTSRDRRIRDEEDILCKYVIFKPTLLLIMHIFLLLSVIAYARVDAHHVILCKHNRIFFIRNSSLTTIRASVLQCFKKLNINELHFSVHQLNLVTSVSKYVISVSLQKTNYKKTATLLSGFLIRFLTFPPLPIGLRKLRQMWEFFIEL